MALTSDQKNRVNKMNRAATAANLGSRMVVSGSHVVTSAQATASSITIQTGVDTIKGKIVQVGRSGSNISAVFATTSGSNLVVTSASATYKIATSDEVNYIVW